MASINKHFTDFIKTHPNNPNDQYYMITHVTGEHRDTDHSEGVHAEVRVDGPFYREQTKRRWRAYFEINIFLSVDMVDDIYVIYEKLGIIQQALTTPIEIFKYGNREGIDDGTLIDCITPMVSSKIKETIETNNYGQIDIAVKVLQSTCEAHYELFLNN